MRQRRAARVMSRATTFVSYPLLPLPSRIRSQPNRRVYPSHRITSSPPHVLALRLAQRRDLARELRVARLELLAKLARRRRRLRSPCLETRRVRALRLREVAVVVSGFLSSGQYYGAKRMEVRTGPSADGPWTPVAAFTSAQTKERQTFAAAPDAPALGWFVQ